MVFTNLTPVIRATKNQTFERRNEMENQTNEKILNFCCPNCSCRKSVKYIKGLIVDASCPDCNVQMRQEEEFKNIDASYINHNPTIIVDCWRIIDVSKLGNKAKYIAIGKGVQ